MKARRGRPPTGRKTTIQVPFDPEDAEVIKAYADTTEQSYSDVVRALVKGEIRWKDLGGGKK